MKTLKLYLLTLLVCSQLTLLVDCAETVEKRDKVAQADPLSKLEAIIKQQLEQVLNDRLGRLTLMLESRIKETGIELAARLEVVEKLSRALIGSIPLDMRRRAFFDAVEAQDTELIRSLRVAGLSMDVRDPYDYDKTGLHKATERNSSETVQVLVDLKAQVDLTAKNETALNIAIRNRNTDIARTLIKAGANVEVGSSGEKPIYQAVWNDLKDLAKDLIDAKVSLDYSDGENRSLLHIAVDSNALQVIPLLIEAKVNVNAQDANEQTPLHYAALRNNHQAAKVLLTAHPEIDAVDVEGRTPLHLAILNKAKEVAKLLVDAKADVNHRLGKNLPMIHLAGKMNSTELVRLLIDAGANMSAASPYYRESPLHWAVIGKNPDMVRMFIDAKVDVNNQALRGETPLQFAVYSESEVIVKMLLAAGADRSLKDKDGKTPKDVAISKPASDRIIAML